MGLAYLANSSPLTTIHSTMYTVANIFSLLVSMQKHAFFARCIMQSRESQPVGSWSHWGTDGPWREIPLKSYMDSVNDLPTTTATTWLVEGFDILILQLRTTHPT